MITNNKQDKMKLENITVVFFSITYYCPFLHYTTIVVKYYWQFELVKNIGNVIRQVMWREISAEMKLGNVPENDK